MFKNKEEKEFVKGYNACIQDLSFSTTSSTYDFLAEAISGTNFSRKQFEEVQQESDFQNDEMERIYDMAFPTN